MFRHTGTEVARGAADTPDSIWQISLTYFNQGTGRAPSGFPVSASLNRKYIHCTYFVNWYLVAIFGNQATIRFLQIQIRAQIVIQTQWIAILQITTHFEEEILYRNPVRTVTSSLWLGFESL